MADDYSIKAVITADGSGFENTVKKVQSKIDSLGKSFPQIQNLTGKLSGALGKLTPQFLAMAGAVSGAVVALQKLGAEMNSATSEIAKGTGAVGEDLYKLSSTMSDVLVGGVTASVKEVGVMIADLNTRFGVTGEALKDMTDRFDAFSRVTGTGTKQAIEGVADVINKWGLSVEEVNPLMDQLLVASQASGASIDELISGLKSGQATLQQFGMSTTKSVAFLSALAKKGIDTSVALQGMKTALAKFAQEGKNASEAFAEVTRQIQNASSDTEALNIAVTTFGSRSGAEMVKVLREGADSADDFAQKLLEAGGALERTDEASRTSADATKELGNTLKGIFGGIGSGIDNLFRDIIDSVKNIVQFIEPILRPILDIVGEMFNAIGQVVKTAVSFITQFINKYSGAFDAMKRVLASTKEFIHNQLGTILDMFKTVFGIIFNLLDGKWALAWEQTKKIILLAGKGIASALSFIANAFIDMINGMIGPINNLINLYNKLATALGWDLAEAIGEISHIDLSKSWGITDELEKVNAKIEELSGETAKKISGELGAITGGYEESAEVAEDVFAQIDLSANESIGNLASWNDKLLQQQIKMIEAERDAELDYIADYVSSEEEKEERATEVVEQYTQKIIDLKKERIQKEMQTALAGVKDTETAEAERLAIIQYYENEIALMESNEQGKRVATLSQYSKKEVAENESKFSKMLKSIKKFASDTVAVFKKIGEVVGKVFTTVGKIVVSAFKGLKGGLEKLFNFNPDEALDSLLVVEDKILTFFVETLPRLPSFLESAIGSVIKTIGQVANNVNFKKIGSFIADMAKTLIQQAPQFVRGVEALFGSILDDLPNIMRTVVSTASDIFVTLVKAIASRGNKIADTLVVMVQSLVQSITDFIANGGWKTLLDAVLAIQKGLEKAIVENIDTLVQSLIDGMPDFIQALTDSIVSASKTLARMIKPIIKLVLKLVEAILNVLFSDEVLDATIEVLVALIEAVFTELLPELLKMLPKLIIKIVGAIIKMIPKLVVAIVTALVKSFISVNWWQVICDIFMGIIDAFKELFGIHSPSTVFEGFGTNIVEGLVNGLKGIAEAIVMILKPACEVVQAIFGALFQSIADVVKYTFDGIVNVLNAIGEPVRVAGKVVVGVLGAIGIALADIFNVISQIVKTITAIHLWIPFVGDVAIGGIDLGQVQRPDITPYISIIDALKDGTDNARKGLTLVGEAGPELVRFNGGEQVLNARNTQNALTDMGKDKGNVFNVTFNNTQDTTAFAMLQQLKQYNRRMAINGIL